MGDIDWKAVKDWLIPVLTLIGGMLLAQVNKLVKKGKDEVTTEMKIEDLQDDVKELKQDVRDLRNNKKH